MIPVNLPFLPLPGHRNLHSARPVKERTAELLGQLPEGHLTRHSEVLGQGLHLTPVPALPLSSTLGEPDGLVLQAPGLIRNHQVGITEELRAQSVTGLAGPQVTIEGKVPRIEVRQLESRLRVPIAGEEGELPPFLLRQLEQCHRLRPTDAQGRLHRISQSALRSPTNHQAIHHHFQPVDLFLLAGRPARFRLFHLKKLSVHP